MRVKCNNQAVGDQDEEEKWRTIHSDHIGDMLFTMAGAMYHAHQATRTSSDLGGAPHMLTPNNDKSLLARLLPCNASVPYMLVKSTACEFTYYRAISILPSGCPSRAPCTQHFSSLVYPCHGLSLVVDSPAASYKHCPPHSPDVVAGWRTC